MSLNNQSGSLSGLGRREEGLAAIEEAVTIRRDLAAARPAVFAGKYASSLRTQAMILLALGRTVPDDRQPPGGVSVQLSFVHMGLLRLAKQVLRDPLVRPCMSVLEEPSAANSR